MTELFPAEPANPALPAEALRPVLAREWGIEGELRALGSLQDQNYRVRTPDGLLAVAKIAGVHTPAGSIALQDAAMRYLATRPISFAAPAPIPTRDGRDGVDVDGHHVRLLSWVEGIPLADRGYVGPGDLVAHGQLVAAVTRAFEGFEHAGLDDPNGWDVRLAGQTLAECRPHLPADWARCLDDGIAAFEQVGVDASLPRAVIHGDLSPVNAVCLPSDELRSTPSGILDFGDVMRTWRIGDLAAAAVGAAEHPGTGDTLDALLAVLTGYHQVLPLTEAEVDAFWPLVIARAAVTAAVSMRQYVRNPGNEYAEQAVTSGLRSVRRVADVPPALARVAARLRVGLPVPDRLAALRAQPPVEVVAGLADAAVLDRSVDSDDIAY
ncbi:MAG: phosphotransferase, partial [Actinobacteria bacterium]|nr:phosphotransferase [Actinomycetota bacterium]